MHSTDGAVAGGGSRRRGISMRCVAADELACDLEMARNAQPGVDRATQKQSIWEELQCSI